MKKLALPLVISCSWALVALIILLGAIKTQQTGRIVCASIEAAVAFGFVLLLVRQLIKLRAKYLGV